MLSTCIEFHMISQNIFKIAVFQEILSSADVTFIAFFFIVCMGSDYRITSTTNWDTLPSPWLLPQALIPVFAAESLMKMSSSFRCSLKYIKVFVIPGGDAWLQPLIRPSCSACHCHIFRLPEPTSLEHFKSSVIIANDISFLRSIH